MKIVDGDLEIKEVVSDCVFERSKPLIYFLIGRQPLNYWYLKEDIIQECALVFYCFVKKHYDVRKKVSIWQYLKVCYRNRIEQFLRKESRNLCFVSLDDEKHKNIMEENFIEYLRYESIKSEIAQKLSLEEKSILRLKLQGYEYEEIFEIMKFKNKTQDKFRPIYRRMTKIKRKLSTILEIDYIIPRIN